MISPVIAAGVAVKSGIVYIARVTEAANEEILANGLPVSCDKIMPSAGLTGAEQLREYGDRIRQHIHETNLSSLGLLDTNLYSNWKYADALARVQAISLVMLACAHETVRFSIIKPNKVAGLVNAPKLRDVDTSLFALSSRPQYWNSGMGEAYSAAAYTIRNL